MRIRWAFISLIAAMAVVLTSCGAEPSGGGGQQTSYKDMKTMVIDILKTEDAQKALQQSSQQLTGYSGQTSKLLSIQDQEEVRLAVKDVLISPDYDKVIKKLMSDTRFAGEFAKSVNKQNKDIHKELIKDPGYQSELVKALKTPEMNKMILEVLQSPQYRKEVMSLMQESMQNPLFKLEVLDLMKKAVQEELKPAPDEKKDKKEEDAQKASDEEGQKSEEASGEESGDDSGGEG